MTVLNDLTAAGAVSVAGTMVHAGQTAAVFRDGDVHLTEYGKRLLDAPKDADAPKDKGRKKPKQTAGSEGGEGEGGFEPGNLLLQD